jgi:hypothetical protein
MRGCLAVRLTGLVDTGGLVGLMTVYYAVPADSDEPAHRFTPRHSPRHTDLRDIPCPRMPTPRTTSPSDDSGTGKQSAAPRHEGGGGEDDTFRPMLVNGQPLFAHDATEAGRERGGDGTHYYVYYSAMAREWCVHASVIRACVGRRPPTPLPPPPPPPPTTNTITTTLASHRIVAPQQLRHMQQPGVHVLVRMRGHTTTTMIGMWERRPT